MALPLEPAWRETAKRRLPSIHGGSAAEDLGGSCSSPPKIKARRLESLPGDLLWPSKPAATTATAAAAAHSRANQLRVRSPLSSPLKRRLQTSVDDDSRTTPSDSVRAASVAASATAAADVDITSNSKMLQSPVRLHFPITSSGAPRAAPELPLFPSAASGCVPGAADSVGSSFPSAGSQVQCSQQSEAQTNQGKPQTRGGSIPSLSLDARSFLTTAAAAAAAAAAAPGSPQGAESAASRRPQQRPSFLDDPTSPFSTSRRRRAPPGTAAATAAANEAVAAAAATPSPTRRAPAAGVRGEIAKTAEEFMDQKVSPVSSRRRASPYHSNSSSNRGGVAFEDEAVSPFRLTPPRKKPQFSFDAQRSDGPPQAVQQEQQDHLEQQLQQQQAAAGCELSLTPQEIASMQQLFSEQQQRSESFCCSSLDTCAAEEAPAAAVRLNRQLERLCRLYGLLRILFDRLHDRGEPLLLFSSILPAYTKLAHTHHPRNVAEPPIVTDSSSNNSSNNSGNGSTGDSGGLISGSSKIRNDLIKDVGRLVWLLPQLLQWKARKVCSSAQNTAPPSAAWSPLRQQQQQQLQYDIQIVELKDGIPLAGRASDGEQRQQQLRRRLISYTLQWQNFCLQLQEQQQQQKHQVPLLRRSRQLMMQHGSWVPGFKVDTVPSPPSAAPPELQRQQQVELQPQQPLSAFKGDSLIGHIGGSPIRCFKQQQLQGQQLEAKGTSGSSTPAASGGCVGGVSSASTCTSDHTADPALGRSPSPALLMSPLCRSRQPTRRFSLLSSPLGSRSPSPPLERRSTSNSASPTRSPLSERLRRKTEERMAARLQREAAQKIRREIYERLQQTKEAQIVLQCLLDACVYHDRRTVRLEFPYSSIDSERIDVRVLTDLFVSKLRTPLPLASVEKAILYLEGLCPASIQFRANVIILDPSTDPSALRKLVDSKLKESEEAALAADRQEPSALLC